MSHNKLAVVGLGGTIAMRPAAAGAVPSLTAEDLVDSLPGEAASLVRHVENFRKVPGAHLLLEDLVALAVRIKELHESGTAEGFVVLQGTDTIEETVFALEILYGGPAAIVVTGAMRHAGQVSADGAANIANALYTAASLESRGRGAMVCFNDQVHAAWAVQKTAATNPAAFTSPGFGPIGHVIEGRARYLANTTRWPAVSSEPGEVRPAKVAIVTASLGEGPELLAAVKNAEYKGLIVQATGAGHLPASWVEPLETLAHNIPVVLATRVSQGPILNETYAFPGSESDLISRGLIPAGFLCASKARILLSMGLGAGLSPSEIVKSFERL